MSAKAYSDISPQLLQTYFLWLRQMDRKTKTTLIEKLTQSLAEEKPANVGKSLFGAWQGTETAEEILADIYHNRNQERYTEPF